MPVAVIAGILAAGTESIVATVVLVLSAAVAIGSVVSLALAWSEGGWARLKASEPAPEESGPTTADRAESLASRYALIHVSILIGSVAALAGAACLFVLPKKPSYVLAVKLAIGGVSGLVVCWRAWRRRRGAPPK